MELNNYCSLSVQARDAFSRAAKTGYLDEERKDRIAEAQALAIVASDASHEIDIATAWRIIGTAKINYKSERNFLYDYHAIEQLRDVVWMIARDIV